MTDIAEIVSTTEAFNWKSIRLVSHPINLAMLQPKGCSQIKMCHLLEDNTHIAEQKPRIVIFDKSYVEQVVASLIIPLVIEAIKNNQVNEVQAQIELLVHQVYTDLNLIYYSALETGKYLTNKEALRVYKNR